MKARVYGWALTNENRYIYKYMEGDLCDVGKTYLDGKVAIENKGDRYTVHQKQIEPIKEITITEEEFDRVCNLIENMTNNNFSSIARKTMDVLKEELFKDVK